MNKRGDEDLGCWMLLVENVSERSRSPSREPRAAGGSARWPSGRAVVELSFITLGPGISAKPEGFRRIHLSAVKEHQA